MPSVVSILKYVRSNGLLPTMAAALRFVKEVRHAWSEGDFDRKYGTDTGGVVDDMEQLGVSKEHAAHAFGYEAIQLDVFARIMADLQLSPADYTFVDFGSGKGRAVMMAAESGFASVLGVEHSPVLHRAAMENCEKLRRKNPTASPISLSCQDAAELEIPDGDLVCFFYNPFDGTILRRVLDKLAAAYQNRPRKLVVVYRNPSCPDVFDSFPFLRLIRSNSSYRVYASGPVGID